MHILVKRKQTKTVHQNRHRNVEITSPVIESLPVSLLPQIAGLIDAEEQNVAAVNMAQDLPDLMDVDGTICPSNSGLRRQNQDPIGTCCNAPCTNKSPRTVSLHHAAAEEHACRCREAAQQ